MASLELDIADQHPLAEQAGRPEGGICPEIGRLQSPDLQDMPAYQGPLPTQDLEAQATSSSKIG